MYEDNLRQFVASEKNVGSARQGKLVGCFFRYVSECSKERRRATALVVLRVFPSLAAALRFRGPVRSGIRIPTTDTSRPVADRLTGGDDSEEMAGRQINVAFTAENAESVAELRANSSRTRHWLPVVVLLLHGTLLAWIDLRSSPTRNELAHLVGGLFVWEFGDFSAYAVNPPLPRAIASVPAACAGLELEEVNRQVARGDRFEWGLRDAYVESYGRRTATHLIWGRLACLSFSLLGGLTCYLWGCRLFCWGAGVCALTLWCFTPLLLGMGATVCTDVPAAALGSFAVYMFWRWLRRPLIDGAIATGAVLGLAELCKFTLVIFYPLMPVLWLLYRFSEPREMSPREWSRQGAMVAAMFLLSIYVINCGYLFAGTGTPLGDYRFKTMMFTGCESLGDVPSGGANRFSGTWMSKFPVPVPADFVNGIDTQRYDFERGLPSYLHGEWSDHGWWYYYLYALAVKMPVGTGLLTALAIGVTVFGRGFNAPWRDEMFVLVPGLVLLVFVSSQTGFSAHSRYAIPALPFLFIWTSKVVRVFNRRPVRRDRRAIGNVVVVALTWSVGSCLWVYPHSLSYFNELIGGPKRGGEHLLDSNIDWGQDLYYLRRWLNTHGIVKLDGFAYHGSYPPTLAGIPSTPEPPPRPASMISPGGPPHGAGHFGPVPGWFALSVHCLYGRDHRYRYFLDYFEPAGTAGYSIYVYRITAYDANRVRRGLGMREWEAYRENSPATNDSYATGLKRWR